MKLLIDWYRPIRLNSAGKNTVGYTLNLEKIPTRAGIYIFGRRWGTQYEALYVGKAGKIRGRVRTHFNNLKLMQHLRDAKSGTRFLLVGGLIRRQGQDLEKCLRLAERAMIRHFLSEGHDLVNKSGTRLRRHELRADGSYPKRFFPREVFLESAKGE